MKPQGLRKLLTFIGVLMLTGYWLDGRSSGPANESTAKRLAFRVTTMGEMIDRDGTQAGFHTAGSSDAHLGFTNFDASDGVKLIAMDGRFRSPEEAKRYLDWRVARASKILTEGTKTDSKGKPVGYRAVLLLAPDHIESAVIWTSGPVFHQIIAKSLPDAVELERRYGQ